MPQLPRAFRVGVVLTVVLLAALAAVVPRRAESAQSPTSNDPASREWIQLFNGRDLADWTIKFAKHELGENFRNTFRVKNEIGRAHV